MNRVILVGIVLLGLAAAGQTPEKGPDGKLDAKVQKKLDALLKQLAAKEPEARVAAVAEIAKLDAVAAVPALTGVLAMPDEELRLHAALALGGLGKPAVPALEKALDHPHETVRFYAVWALGLAGPTANAATPAVIRALADEDEEVRYKAAFALARIAPDADEAVAALVAALADQDADVVNEVSASLARLGQRAVPALRKALVHEKLGWLAADTLSKMGQSEESAAAAAAASAIPDILRAFDGSRSTDMGVLLTVLPAFGTKALPAFRAAIKEKNAFARARLAQVLGQIGANAEAMGDTASAKTAVEMLILLLADGDTRVRVTACAHLSPITQWLGDSQPALEKAILDDSMAVSWAAYQALATQIPDLPDRVAKRIVAAKGEDKLRLACLLPTQNLKLLTANLKHPDPLMRRRCACALAAHVGNTTGADEVNQQIEAILLEGLASAQAPIRREAAVALVRAAAQSGKTVIGALQAALKDEDAEVRSIALAALAQVPGRDSKQLAAAAASLLKDPDGAVRQNAIQTLRLCGVPAVPQLIGLLKDKDSFTRAEACDALKALKSDAPEFVPALAVMARDAENRALAVSALHEIAPASSFARLLEMLQADKTVGPALRRLEKAGKDPSSVIRALLRELKDPDATVSRGAAEALEQVVLILPPEECLALKQQAVLPAIKAQVPALSKQLTAAEASTRRQTAEVLAQLVTLTMMIEQRVAGNPNNDVVQLINEIEPLRQEINTALERARNDSDLQIRRIARRALRMESPANDGIGFPPSLGPRFPRLGGVFP